MSLAEPLRTLRALLPDWPVKRINKHAREGRIPGAKKIGRDWMILESAFVRWISGAASGAPTAADALAELRKRGL